MLPDKAWITVTHKFNLGNYESVEYSASLSCAIDNGENPQETLDTLIDVANQAIKNRVPESYQKRTVNWSERFTRFGQEVIEL